MFTLPILFAVLAPPAGPQSDSTIRITTYPEHPLIERGAEAQFLNFDFGLTNGSSQPREILRIELSVFDPEGRLVHRQFVSATGAAAPGLLTVPDRAIPANGDLSLFNPFYTLPAHLTLGRLHFEFVFESRGLEPLATAAIDVEPRAYRPSTRLTLPVDGPAIVYDGHDFYSHHRRIPLGSALARRFGLESNPVRYANDWSPVGPGGELARGPLAVPANWYAYGALVRAPAGGVVISAVGDVPDNRIDGNDLVMAKEARADELRGALGNHLIIKHADGEYGVLAHLKTGTVRHQAGQAVKQGEVVGEIGFSGDTGYHVHLHHMLVTQPGLKGEGLPAYFDRVQRVALRGGATPVGTVLMEARLDTGDLVRSAR